MTSINDFMTGEHRRCDEMLTNAEQAVDKQNWEKANSLTEEFMASMERHFLQEEQVLFPAFEERSGNVDGPTQVMREEHQQMRNLLYQLQWSLESESGEEYLDASETLLVMQQHNMKEEGILYPMTDELLGPEAEQLIATIQEM
jgi:iron-sulfur cluster repair protein YtfE (RIC family)